MECHHKCGECIGTPVNCTICSGPNRDIRDDCNCSSGWFD